MLLTLYTGVTEVAYAEEALAYGFGRSAGGSLYDPWGLYLTDNPRIARFYAARLAWERGSIGAVLGVKVNTQDLRADLRAYQLVNAKYVREGLLRVPVPRFVDWRMSLRDMGSVVHRGTIPPEDVVLVEAVRGARRVRFLDPRPLARTLVD